MRLMTCIFAFLLAMPSLATAQTRLADVGPVFIDFGNVSELVTTSDLLRREHSVDPDDDPQTTYAHILVDESQDVTPMQWRMLRRRGPQASWTLVGDPAPGAEVDLVDGDRGIKGLPVLATGHPTLIPPGIVL